VHLGDDAARAGALSRIARPQRGLRELLGEVLDDRERIPDREIASTSTGTRPVGVSAPMRRLNSEPASKLSKRTWTSSKGRPKCVISTQGRMDHEE
jgi:hypothetical protein